MQSLNSKQRSHGFTLVELLITIAIAAILLAVAIPSLRGMILANRIQSATSEFQSALAIARAEAIKRGGDAKVTIVANSMVGGTPDWTSGVTVFYDRTANANANAPPTDPTLLIMRTSAAQADVVIGTAATPPRYISYNGLGRSVTVNGAPLAGTIAFGAAESGWRCAIINFQGRVRVVATTKEIYSAAGGGCPTN